MNREIEKLRAWQRRSKPMKRGPGPKRGKRLNPFGRRWKRRKAAGDVFGPLAAMVRMLPCDVCGARGPSDPHHVRSRGAGFGDWLPNGDGNLVAACRSCHRLIESERDRWRDRLAERAREHGEFLKGLRAGDTGISHR